MIRPEATGYGQVYFAKNMMEYKGQSFKDKIVTISGSGNVAQYACEKVLEFGGKPVTFSDSQGTVYDPEGINTEKLHYVMELKNEKRGRIKEYLEKYPKAQFIEGKRPWHVKCDVALPSATQNEISEEEA